ncbi:MAG: PAS domain S-box protein [Chlorobiales bacterium]|nr:PAS domain S-box protein [Chlorobiales bacterium]
MPKHSKKIALGMTQLSCLAAVLLDSIADPAFVVDPAGIILEMNSAGAGRFAAPGGDITRSSFYELEETLQQGPESMDRLKEKVSEVVRTGRPLTLEKERGGKTIRFTVTPVCTPDGSVGLLVIVVQECVDQKSLDVELQKERLVYKSFRETMSHSFSILDARGYLIEWNKASRDTLFGRSEEEMLGFDGFQVIHPDDREYARDKFLNVLNRGVEEELEARVLVHGGPEYLWRMIYGKKVMIEGKPCVFNIGVDITERKRAENELHEKQTRFSQALEATHAGVWEWDLTTGENVWSDETWELNGLTRGNQKPSFELWASSIHPDDRKGVIEAVGDAANKSGEINIEYRVNLSDDRAYWLMSRGKPLLDDKGHAVRYIGTVTDITERKMAEEALKRSEERFRKMFEKHSAIQLVLDPETGAIINANQAAADFYGWSVGELRTMGIQDINTHPTEEVRLVLDQWKTSEQQSFVFGHRRADGSIRDVEIYGCRIPVNGKAFAYLILHDITERKKAEEERESLQVQLQHSQKMQMVGQLAGGIAHDFNNMLMVILGHTELALQNKDSSFEDLEAIHKAAMHSAELTSQLLAFARRQTVKTKVFDLNTEVERMLSILKRLIGENITLRWMPGLRESLVQLDPSQIDQILANLCVNARDAIAKSGIVTIETAQIHVDEAASAAGHACSIPGEYVMLTVTDTGEGIDKKHLPHVIEPFFTTKEVGKGTGMGLATVYGIVKQNHGCIEVKSQKGQGTSVRIYLPLQRRHDTAGRRGKKEQALPQDKEMILLVEDQPDILQLCRQMLERSGYSVLAALGPGEALELARGYQGKIELLVTDVVMPEMNGSDLYRELQTIYPHLKALFMSGYTADFLAQHLKGENGMNFIEKPFTFASFTRIVREILKKVPE